MRNYPDWIEACASLITADFIPDEFKWWTAASAVAGAMRRHCWYDHGAYKVRPNMFICLVAPPGAGKTVSLELPYGLVFDRLTSPLGIEGTKKQEQVEKAKLSWQQYIPGEYALPLHLMRGKITPEQMTKELAEAGVSVLDVPGEPVMDAAATVVTTEFGTFMQRNNQMLHMVLTESWDSNDAGFEYRTKNMGKYVVRGACINWLACVTPDEFVSNMPANAGSQGLLSRIVPVYVDTYIADTGVGSGSYDAGDVHRLAQDLGDIASLRGEFKFAPGVAEDIIIPWRQKGERPQPTDPMMREYASRRFSHLRKLAMAVSAGRRNDKLITADDWETATKRLFAAERNMPAVLRRFGMSEAGRFVDDLYAFIQNKKVCTTRMLRREAMRITKSVGEVDRVIDLLKESGMANKDEDGNWTVSKFK